ncbi:hypothetical protein NJB93_18845 [Brucella intermedia]|uniref:hypothetical protein n=1 Tax=Brucella intermedia TaxID=94625 RepID=UPI00209B8993|nr:hypothetical protein [Brucella intermedia]MCO7728646.1 hypothetical protein [Brucella intermedia]
MGGNTITVISALIAAFASAYSAYQSRMAAAESAISSANSNTQIAEMQKATTDRQSDIELVKLALNILGGEVSDKTRESRKFAVSLLNKYSGVVINPDMGEQWAESGTVSFSSKPLGLSSRNEPLQGILKEYFKQNSGIVNPIYRPDEAPTILNND